MNSVVFIYYHTYSRMIPSHLSYGVSILIPHTQYTITHTQYTITMLLFYALYL